MTTVRASKMSRRLPRRRGRHVSGWASCVGQRRQCRSGWIVRLIASRVRWNLARRGDALAGHGLLFEGEGPEPLPNAFHFRSGFWRHPVATRSTSSIPTSIAVQWGNGRALRPPRLRDAALLPFWDRMRPPIRRIPLLWAEAQPECDSVRGPGRSISIALHRVRYPTGPSSRPRQDRSPSPPFGHGVSPAP